MDAAQAAANPALELQQPADDAGATKALSELTVVDEKPPAPAPATQTTAAAAAEPELEPVVEQSVVERSLGAVRAGDKGSALSLRFPRQGRRRLPPPGRGSASSERKSGGGGFSLFGGKKKGSTTKEPASKSDFSQPLHLCTLDANGVPKRPERLAGNPLLSERPSRRGHLSRLFSITGLKAAREQADAGKITSLTIRRASRRWSNTGSASCPSRSSCRGSSRLPTAAGTGAACGRLSMGCPNRSAARCGG